MQLTPHTAKAASAQPPYPSEKWPLKSQLPKYLPEIILMKRLDSVNGSNYLPICIARNEKLWDKHYPSNYSIGMEPIPDKRFSK